MATTAYHTLAILIYGTVLYSGIADARILVFDAYNETVDEFSDIEVPYGSDLLQTLKGLVVLANPFDACSPIQDAYNSSVYASFVLMFGNLSVDCPGHLKVLNAQRAGFDAAILFGGMLPFGQVAVSSEAVIPALIVEYKAGLRIMNNYIFKNKNGSDFYWLTLIPNSQDISYYITLFSCVVGFVFLIFLCFMIGLICLLLDEVDSKFSGHFILHNDFFYNYWHLFHDNASLHNLFGKSVYYWMELIPYSDIISYCLMMFSVISGICLMTMVILTIRSLVKCVRERRRTRRNRLSARQIRQLGTERFTEGAPYDTCAICLEEYKEGEKLRILPCGHVYHMKCIDPWLQNNRRTCPLCKRRIRFGDSDSSSSNDSDTSSLHTNEESPLIPPPPPPHHPTLRVSVSDSSLLVQRVTSGLMQLLGETNEQFQNAEENDHPDVLLEPQSNHEVSDSHPSTYGSVNNSEGDEFVDALTPGETSTSSVVLA